LRPKTEQELTLSHCNWTVVNKGLPSRKANENPNPNQSLNRRKRSKYKYRAKLGVILCPGWVKYELRKFYFGFVSVPEFHECVRIRILGRNWACSLALGPCDLLAIVLKHLLAYLMRSCCPPWHRNVKTPPQVKFIKNKQRKERDTLVKYGTNRSNICPFDR